MKERTPLFSTFPGSQKAFFSFFFTSSLRSRRSILESCKQKISSALHPSFCPENSCWSCCTFLKPRVSGEGEFTFPGKPPRVP